MERKTLDVLLYHANFALRNPDLSQDTKKGVCGRLKRLCIPLAHTRDFSIPEGTIRQTNGRAGISGMKLSLAAPNQFIVGSLVSARVPSANVLEWHTKAIEREAI